MTTENRYPSGFVGRTNKQFNGKNAITGGDRVIEKGVLVLVILCTREYLLFDNSVDADDTEHWHTIVTLHRSGHEGTSHKQSVYDRCEFGDLDPEPGVVSWSRDCQLAAQRQGWEIFQTDCSGHPPFELQKIDGSEEDTTKPNTTTIGDRFARDEDAWLFVWKGAVEHDDPTAKRALEFLYARSPGEYKNIRTHCLKVTQV